MSTFLESLSLVPAGAVARATLLSAVAWLADATIVLVVARALGLEISVPQAVLLGLGGALGTALPAAPGYIATYELGAVAFGAFGGVPEHVVLPIAVIVHVIGVGGLALAGAASSGRMSSGIEPIRLRRSDLEGQTQ